jgi:hypothetical protein
MTNNHNLFPLPTWAPALRRVPMPLQLLDQVYARGDRACNSVLLEKFAPEPAQDFMRAFCFPLPSGRGR